MARLLAAAWLLGCCATCCAVSAKPRRNLGPGRGPWEFATPESQGLSTDALRAAEERVNEEMGGDRFCFIVVKNGYMVHETYRRGHQPSSLFGAWSATKSLCASLYGVAVQQGWANATDMVRERNSNTRQCNADRHQLPPRHDDDGLQRSRDAGVDLQRRRYRVPRYPGRLCRPEQS